MRKQVVVNESKMCDLEELQGVRFGELASCEIWMIVREKK